MVNVLELIFQSFDLFFQLFDQRLVLELNLLSVDHSLSFLYFFFLIINGCLFFFLLQMQDVLFVDNGSPFNSFFDVFVQLHIPRRHMNPLQLLYLLLQLSLLLLLIRQFQFFLSQLLIHLLSIILGLYHERHLTILVRYHCFEPLYLLSVLF